MVLRKSSDITNNKIVNISFFSLCLDLFWIIVKEVNKIRNNVVCVVARLAFLFCCALQRPVAFGVLFNIFSKIKRNQSFTAHIYRLSYFLWLWSVNFAGAVKLQRHIYDVYTTSTLGRQISKRYSRVPLIVELLVHLTIYCESCNGNNDTSLKTQQKICNFLSSSILWSCGDIVLALEKTLNMDFWWSHGSISQIYETY